MGRDKQRMEEDQDQRWAAPNKFVCTDCVEDSFLKKIITDNLAKRKCDYCGKGSKGFIAAPVTMLMEPIVKIFFTYFENPDHAGIPSDGGDYAFDLNITTEDALHHISLECCDTLFNDVAGGIGNDTLWVEAAGGSWASEQPSDFMIDGWERFAKKVKHESRFFFATHQCRINPSDYDPTEVLEEIGRSLTDMGFVQVQPAGTTLFRARLREADAIWPLEARELGPPPNEKSLSQRMNPAGISYFYLAKERETALAEGMRKPPCTAAIGSFTLRRDVWLLNLTKFPELPSIFDLDHRFEHELLLFLSEFSRQISKPVEKDGREHIEYVPSQVVSEYFAKVYRKADGNPLDGMAYESAVRPGGVNIVLFPPQKEHECFIDLAEFASAEEIDCQHWVELFDTIR